METVANWYLGFSKLKNLYEVSKILSGISVLVNLKTLSGISVAVSLEVAVNSNTLRDSSKFKYFYEVIINLKTFMRTRCDDVT